MNVIAADEVGLDVVKMNPTEATNVMTPTMENHTLTPTFH